MTVTDEGGTYSYELRFRGNKEGLLEEVALSSPFIGPDDWDNMDSNIYLLEMIRGMLVLSVAWTIPQASWTWTRRSLKSSSER